MNRKIRIQDINKIFNFTVIYFISLALITWFLESFENSNILTSFWHFLTNIINFLVLATTIFLITLNNPITSYKNKLKNNLRKNFYYLFNFIGVVVTLISPLAILNSRTQDYIIKFISNFEQHKEKFIFHTNWIVFILILATTIFVSILFFSAKIFNTTTKIDDEMITDMLKQAEDIIN